MRTIGRACLAWAWLMTLSPTPLWAAHGFEPKAVLPSPPAIGSEFALASPLVEDGLLAARGMTRTPKEPKPKSKPKEEAPPASGDSSAAAPVTEHASRMGAVPSALSGERARAMLQSLTVPGWGQASQGQTHAALAFGLVEAGIWVSFAAFQVQETMRSHTYERTASLFGGIDLSGRDEEYRHVVGLYRSSDDYNIYVVRRDAANLYYGDPASYDAYVAAHAISGADAWAWRSDDDLIRYRDERQAAQRATKHAQDALAAAIINRLVSVVHAARSSTRPAADATSWRLEVAPEPGDLTGFRVALRADF
jgi:hypothetical protein